MKELLLDPMLKKSDGRELGALPIPLHMLEKVEPSKSSETADAGMTQSGENSKFEESSSKNDCKELNSDKGESLDESSGDEKKSSKSKGAKNINIKNKNIKSSNVLERDAAERIGKSGLVNDNSNSKLFNIPQSTGCPALPIYGFTPGKQPKFDGSTIDEFVGSASPDGVQQTVFKSVPLETLLAAHDVLHGLLAAAVFIQYS